MRYPARERLGEGIVRRASSSTRPHLSCSIDNTLATHDNPPMRLIGTLPTEADSKRFCDYLLTRKIAAHAEPGTARLAGVDRAR